MSDLKKAFETLTKKGKSHTLLWDYYDGNHRVFHITKKLQEMFGSKNIYFSENWCAVIVDAMLDRIILKRFVIAESEKLTKRLNEIWETTEMNLDDDEAHLCTLVTGEAYLMAWKEKEEIDAYYQDSRLCHIQYDESRPKKKRFAAKWWVNAEKKRCLTLYYPDKLEYYQSMVLADKLTSHTGLIMSESLPNPLGEIPMVHIRRSSRKLISELQNAIDPQNAVNKLIADMMVVSEFGAFPQRYAITEMDLSHLASGPAELWELPAGDGHGEPTRVGQFAAANLNQYLAAIERSAQVIGVITRTPKHFFFGQGGDPSGEALITMEAPLNAKCIRFIERAKVSMQKFASLLLKLDGYDVLPGMIEPIYQEPKTAQPLTLSITRQNNVSSGLPLRTQLRQEGWSEQQIEQMEADRVAEEAASQTSLASALVNAQRKFDQS